MVRLYICPGGYRYNIYAIYRSANICFHLADITKPDGAFWMEKNARSSSRKGESWHFHTVTYNSGHFHTVTYNCWHFHTVTYNSCHFPKCPIIIGYFRVSGVCMCVYAFLYACISRVYIHINMFCVSICIYIYINTCTHAYTQISKQFWVVALGFTEFWVWGLRLMVLAVSLWL